MIALHKCQYSFEVSWIDGKEEWDYKQPYHYCSEMCTSCFLKLFPRDVARTIEMKNLLLDKCDFILFIKMNKNYLFFIFYFSFIFFFPLFFNLSKIIIKFKEI